jgi:hypothetical protein
MRLNARTGAALLAIVVGLGLIVFGALGSKGSLPGTLKPAPEIPVAKGTIAPLEPNTGVHKSKNTSKGSEEQIEAAPGFSNNIFDTEYGERGEHDVKVTISANGTAGYVINWRDGKSERGTTSGLTRERTLKGGLPLAQVGVQGLPASGVTCTITVDGVEKVTKTTRTKYGIALCNG